MAAANITSANGAIAIWAKGGDVNQFVGSIQSGNGNIYLAGSNITQRAGAAIQTTGSGAVVLNATNRLEMNGIVRSASGDIVMGAETVLVNGTLHAGRNVGIESRSSITGPGVIEAQAIALRAATDIGEDAGNRLHVKANKLATEAGGSVFISAAGSVESAVVDIQGVTSGRPPCATNMPVPNVEPVSYITAGGDLDILVEDDLTGPDISSEGDLKIEAGSLDVDSLTANHGNANLDIGGDTSIDTINVGDDFILNGGGDFTFDTLDAGGVQVDVGGGMMDLTSNPKGPFIKAGSLMSIR